MDPVTNKNNLIFALDIGTRTIIGLVCKKTESGYLEIMEYSIREHEERNMYDGQIHDIYRVAAVVRDIVEELEEKIGIALKDVAVAAAGRALKTKKIRIDQAIDENRIIGDFNIEALELEAMQKAQTLINEEDNGESKYYSIGYSTVAYYLDDNKIENLLGHKGVKIGVEVLATFLPKIVIDGLNSVISSLGMRITSITLEPIAAINIAIEKDLRLLNLALVDIGAGTSDIAITKEGEVISYSMTQTAGDEITEAILKNFLMDFKSSESLKRELSTKESHTVEDILGLTHTYSTEEILDKIDYAIKNVSDDISNAIIEANTNCPDAVFLIGGGSQIPRIKDYIGKNLKIDPERIAIKKLSSIKNLQGVDKIEGIDRPDMITPLGIALEGLNNRYRNFIDIEFNGEKIPVFNRDNINVSDILILKEYDPKKLLTKWGEDFVYYKNKKRRVIKGREGTKALITVNGEEGDLQTRLSHGDEVRLEASIVDEIKEIPIGKLISEDIPIENIRVNGQVVQDSYMVKRKDNIEVLEDSREEVYQIEEAGLEKTIDLKVNGKDMSIEYSKDKFVFVDIFNYIDFDRSKVKGSLCLKVNNQDTNYFKELENGDVLDIYWEDLEGEDGNK